MPRGSEDESASRRRAACQPQRCRDVPANGVTTPTVMLQTRRERLAQALRSAASVRTATSQREALTRTARLPQTSARKETPRSRRANVHGDG
jgi:hypothetical protein